MPAEVLSLRAINRALLSRQRLLDRPALPAAGSSGARAAMVVETIEHLAGRCSSTGSSAGCGG
jgi:hypothetical protein